MSENVLKHPICEIFDRYDRNTQHSNITGRKLSTQKYETRRTTLLTTYNHTNRKKQNDQNMQPNLLNKKTVNAR